MKKISYSLITLLILTFVIRIGIGYATGGAESDAGGYTTYAIQMAQEGTYEGIVNLHTGRVIFHLWLFVLVMMMKVFGATNLVAIVTTALLGTVSVYAFYRLVNNYWDSNTSLLISTLLIFNPTHINISHNAFYDALLITILLFTIDYFVKYMKTYQTKYLIISALIGTLLATVHATGYIYIFILWILFPVLYRGESKIKYWFLFSGIIGIYPVIQMGLWKFSVNSIFPYQQLQYNQRFLHQFKDYTFELRHYIRHIIYLIISYSPLIFLSLWLFIADNRWRKDKYKIIGFFTILLFFIVGFSLGIEKDKLSLLTIIYSISFVIFLKRHLIKSNALIVISGMFALVIFTLYLRIFPRSGFGPRQFIYPVIFLIPVLWFYFEKYFKRRSLLVLMVLLSYSTFGLSAFYFNIGEKRSISPPGFNVTYGKILTPSLPYYIRPMDEVRALKWCKKQNVGSTDFILTNLRGHYISSNLNMPQNHLLNLNGLSYSHTDGFSIRDISDYFEWLKKNDVHYIILNPIIFDKEYKTVTDDGKQKINMSCREFIDTISATYLKDEASTKELIFLKKI